MKDFFSIGIAGLGNVGSATIHLLKTNANLINRKAGIPIRIVAVSAKRKSIQRSIGIDEYDWESKAENLALREDIDAVVELMGGEDGVAKNLVTSSLNKGKHVITANKALVARHSAAINKLLVGKNIGFYFEAAVAAAIPIISAIKFGVSSNQINRIQGILNGTCNFILSEMKNNNSSFESALHRAQKLGFAEADPFYDIEGVDASQKLSILAMLAFGVSPELNNIYTEGIKNISNVDMKYAAKLGYSIKLFCIANLKNENLDLRVHPALISENSVASHVSGALNAVFLEADSFKKLTFIGEGAGPFPTASSVVSDIINAARNRDHVNNHLILDMKKYSYKSMNDRIGSYYIRLLVTDVRGVISKITSYLNENDISLDSIIQDSNTKEKLRANIVIITHEAKERNINKSVKLIKKMKTVIEEPQIIRVEKI